MDNTAIIMTGGTNIDEDQFYLSVLEQAKFTIAVDSGMEVLLRLKLAPTILIGDMDSLSESSLKAAQKLNVVIEQYSSDKDKTDTELALDLAISQGYLQIIILGGIGSRLDHTLANLHLLEYGINQNAIVEIRNPWHQIQLLTPKRSLTISHPQKTVSIIALSENLEGLTLQGFKWNLDNQDFVRESSMGISNICLGEQAYISLKRGKAFVIKVWE